MKAIQVDELLRFAQAALEAVGVGAENARTITNTLVTTDTFGVFSHGTNNLYNYIRKIQAGGLDAKAVPTVEKEGPSWAIVNGNAAMGMVSSCRAMELAIEKAKKTGIAYVGVHNSCHFGAAGYYANLAAQQGLLGIAMSNTDPNMAIPGSRDVAIGNNPFSFAAPLKNGKSVFLDIALSGAAALKIVMAREKGQQVPPGFLIDAEGLPTTDPSGFPYDSHLLPMAAHKGYGFAIMVEILASVLTGAGRLSQVVSWNLDLEAKNNVGHAFIAVDLAQMLPMDEFEARMEQTVQELTPRDTYTAAMIEYESLQKLGEAIYDQNMDTVVMILDSMGRRLHEKTGMEQVDALMNLVYDVNGSLAKPLRDNSQEQLRQAMMMFAGGLESAAEMVYNGRDNTQMIDTALETVETYIRDYLGVPEEGERYDPFAHMDYGKGSKPSGAPSPEAANVEKPKSRMETEYVYDPPEALKASGYQPGALNERGERQRLSADTRERPMGAVPYGEVYGRYYAAYLAMIEDETFPQALREAAQAYMNGL